MNNLDKEKLIAGIKLGVIAAIVIALTITAVRIFWPLLLAGAVYFAYRVFKNKKELERMSSMNTSKMENDLFYEQVRRRKDPAEIIDVEFTESKNTSEEERQ